MPQVLQAAEIAGKPSMQDLMERVQCAVNKANGDECGCYCWVSDLTETDAVMSKGGEYFRYPYSVGADGAVTLGEPVEVTLSWKDAPDADDALAASDGRRGDMAFVTDMRGLTFSEGSPTIRIEVCRDGKWKHPKFGDIEVTPEIRQRFKENFDTNVRKVGELPLDYDHVPGPAPGWIVGLHNEGSSLYSDVKMTPSGRQAVQDGEYRFFSPEWVKDFKDPETGRSYGPTLFGGGFTNRPFFRGMAAICCSETAPGGEPEEHPMPENNPAGTKTATEPAIDNQKFNEMMERLTAVEVENASLRAAEEKRELVQTFGEVKVGKSVIVPASREALADAVQSGDKAKMIAAVQGLQFAELGERGDTIEGVETGGAETLTASEEARIDAEARQSGQDPAVLKKTFLEIKKRRAAR